MSVWPEAWNYLSKQQKRDYLRFRMEREGKGARHLWPQTLGNVAILNKKNVGFLQRGMDNAEMSAMSIVTREIDRAWGK